MVDMFFEFHDLCTTIPPVEYGGNEDLLETFATKVLQLRWMTPCMNVKPEKLAIDIRRMRRLTSIVGLGPLEICYRMLVRR